MRIRIRIRMRIRIGVRIGIRMIMIIGLVNLSIVRINNYSKIVKRGKTVKQYCNTTDSQ